MDPDIQSFAQVMVILVSSFGGVVLISGLAKWIFFRKRPAALPRSEKEDDRLRRIEEAVDAIAVEVERISEGQRFTTKLLAERIPELDARARDAAPVKQARS